METTGHSAMISEHRTPTSYYWTVSCRWCEDLLLCIDSEGTPTIFKTRECEKVKEWDAREAASL
jgi:hypothetical protein